MKRTIHFGLWLFALLLVGGVSKAQIPLGNLEKLDISALKKGESVECYMVYKTLGADQNWLALDHSATSVKQGTVGTSGERLYVGFTSLTEAARYDPNYCWKITKYDDTRYIVEWNTPVPYTTTGRQYVDENGLIRSDGHSDWMRFFSYKEAASGAFTLGHATGGDACKKLCWKYNSANQRLETTSGQYAATCAHSYDFYFLKYEFSSTTESDLATYQLAYDKATDSYNEMYALDNNLANLKAIDENDGGKFDSKKIEILEGLGTVYTRDQYTTEADRATVIAATAALQSVVNLKSTFYKPALVPVQGWYRLKAKVNNAYLNSDMTFSGIDRKEDGSQYFYLKSASDVATRLQLYPFDALKTGVETLVGCYGNMVANARHFQLYDCGARGIFMRSGGNSTDKWVALNPDNTIQYETNTVDLLDHLLFFEMEPLGADESVLTAVSDGEYVLSFNGVEKSGTYVVTDGLITVDGTDYPLVSHGGVSYSIGTDKVETLKGDLTKNVFITNRQNPNNALPHPGFRLTPVVDALATELTVSCLTSFAANALNGKSVKVTGTVDFANLESAGASELALIDNQPFHAYSGFTLNTSELKYTRVFNPSASGAYSTAEAPKWQTICLPFEVEQVDGYCPVTYAGGDADLNWVAGVRQNLSAASDYWLYELTPSGFVRTTTGIKANVPYIIAFPYSWIGEGVAGSYAPKLNVSGEVLFCGKAVAATTESTGEGADFSMTNNFAQVPAGTNVYVLDASGTYFEQEVVSANPFRPYAFLPDAGNGGTPARLYLFEEGTSPTGLSPLPSLEEAVKVIAVVGGVQVTSATAHTVRISSVGGASLGSVSVEAGTQLITLPVGIFVVDGVKVIVTE